MKDVQFDCPNCQQLLEGPADMVGLFIECPKCQSVIKVPRDREKATAHEKTPPPRSGETEKEKDEESLKSSTIRIELPPNLGIPETPIRKITIRRKT